MRWREIKHTKKQHHKQPQAPAVRYAGFGSRALGFVTDIFMIGLPVTLLIVAIFGYDETKRAGAMDVIVQSEAAVSNAPDPLVSIIQILLSMAVYTFMWRRNGQTPGKKMARTRVVDAKTLHNASWFQLAVRFIGYFISAITLIGFFIGFMRRDKRALHDLISRTAVIYE